MKTQRTDHVRAVRWLSTVLLFGVVLTLMLPAGAWAIGTASSTPIENQATIVYDVSGVRQPGIDSDGDTTAAGIQSTLFLVDNLVDLAVTTLDGAAVQVAPGATSMVLRFRLDNQGNTTQDFHLSAVAQATGGPYATPFGATLDAFDADTTTNPVRIYQDENVAASTTGYTPGGWSGTGLESVVTYVDELPADFSVTLYIVIDIPAGQLDDDMSVYGLLARVADGGGAGAMGGAILTDNRADADTNGVEVVFGDADGPDDPDGVDADDTDPDGYHSSRSVYHIVTATLAAIKSSTVISDPINLGVNPKAIPGATVAYAITVNNTGNRQADDVIITDHIMQFTSDVTFVSGTASAANNDGISPSIEYSVDGATWDTNETSPVNWIRATHSRIRATDGQGTLVFRVTIN